MTTAKATCERCGRRSMHYAKDCPGLCPTTGETHAAMWERDHEAFSPTYQSYGYWHARCPECGQNYEVDSSG